MARLSSNQTIILQKSLLSRLNNLELLINRLELKILEDPDHQKLRDLIVAIENQPFLELQKLEEQVTTLVTELSGINFINRDDELKILTNHNDWDLIILDAPIHSGKSYLLSRVREKLVRNGWFVIFIDFRQETKAAKSEKEFLHLLCEYIPGTVDKEELSFFNKQQIRNRIIAELSSQKLKVALIFDSVELINKTLAHSIRKFVYDLQSATKAHGSIWFRGIVSGRYIRNQWEEQDDHLSTQPKFRSLSLSPFESMYIREALDRMLAKARQGSGLIVNESIKNRIVLLSQMVSCGYPDCLASILLDIGANTNFSGFPSNFVSEHHVYLYRNDVEPIVKRLQAEIPIILVKLFTYLSIFRCCNSEIIQRVIVLLQELSLSDGCSQINPEETLRKLSNSGLINENPTNKKGLSEIIHIRRLNAIGLWIDKPEVAKNLNNLALDYYRFRLENPDQNIIMIYGYEYYQTLLIEYLFHYAVSLAHSSPSKNHLQKRTELSQELDILLARFFVVFPTFYKLPKFECEHVKHRIVSCLEDTEVQAELGHFIPETEYKRLIEEVVTSKFTIR